MRQRSRSMIYIKGAWQGMFSFKFFSRISSPGPWVMSILFRQFQIFTKILGDTVLRTFMFITIVTYTGDKLFPIVKGTSDRCCWHRWTHFYPDFHQSLVPFIPEINLSPVSSDSNWRCSLSCLLSSYSCLLSSQPSWSISNLSCLLSSSSCSMSSLSFLLSSYSCSLSNLSCFLSSCSCSLSALCCTMFSYSCSLSSLSWSMSNLSCLLSSLSCLLSSLLTIQLLWSLSRPSCLLSSV